MKKEKVLDYEKVLDFTTNCGYNMQIFYKEDGTKGFLYDKTSQSIECVFNEDNFDLGEFIDDWLIDRGTFINGIASFMLKDILNEMYDRDSTTDLEDCFIKNLEEMVLNMFLLEEIK